MANAEEHMENVKNRPIFCELSADDLEPTISEIESLCMECNKNGTTKLLLTKIPHYEDVILMSFNCDHCGYQNNEIQNSGKILEKGIKVTLRVASSQDLNRQVIKSDYTSVHMPHLGFEIPAHSQTGEITTVEGIIDRTINDLGKDQPRRHEEFPDTATEIDLFINKLRALKELDEPFNIIFEDISGKCHVENPKAPLEDNECTVVYFKRTTEQNRMLGIYSENEDALLKPIQEGEYPFETIIGEILTFPTNCPDCNQPCETNMKLTNIPHFKEVVIMATTCESCGHRTNEVKSGSGIEPQGVKIEVTITGKADFNRDVLKSETCDMTIPELELETSPTIFGGRFTTVEGIIIAIKDQLSSSRFFIGDSTSPETVKRMETFLAQLTEVLEGQREVTLVLNDPAGNSYVQSLSSKGLDDKLKITKYDRSFEQNEELGLNDMKVENYQT